MALAIYTGVKYKLVDWGVSTAMGWKVTKIAGLPSGITWDAKNQKLKGYTKKTGTYNGKSFSESAVLWYEVNQSDPSTRYLRIRSFSIGLPITYVLKYDGGILQTVSAPSVPQG